MYLKRFRCMHSTGGSCASRMRFCTTGDAGGEERREAQVNYPGEGLLEQVTALYNTVL